jgi:hypothetical protein
MSTTLQKIFGVVVVVGAICGALAFCGLTLSGAVHSFGASFSGDVVSNPQWFSNGFFGGQSQQFAVSSTGATTIGTNGTAFNRLDGGTCYIKPWATTIAASSTQLADCQGTAAVGSSTGLYLTSALAGVTLGDSVVTTMATGTASTVYGGIDIEAASASSTPGYIQLLIANQTGATFTWPTTGTASGTVSYLDMH